MADKKKAWISDGKENSACPNCGNAMSTVVYYTARPVRQEEIRRDANTKTIITTYTDVNGHIGNICRFCAYENAKSKRTIGLALLICGGVGSAIAMLAGLIQSNIAEARGGNIGAAMGTSMGVMVALVIPAVIGLAIFLEANAFQPNRSQGQEQLYLLFVKHMQKENHQSSIVYLSPLQAAQLKKKIG